MLGALRSSAGTGPTRPLTPVPFILPWDDLAIERAVDEAVVSGRVKLPVWRSPPLGPYNGHSGELRVTAWQKIKAAVSLGLIPPATQCSVCGASEGRIDYHNEDYTRPLLTIPICQRCHLALHRRERSPAAWQRIVAEHGDGSKWFEHLP